MSEPFVSIGLPAIAFERWGAAPVAAPKPAIQPVSGTTIVISNIDAAPDEFRPDTTYQNLIQLAREYSPAELTEYRRRARFGDPRWLFAFYDEALRVGINVQHSKMLVRMRSARITFNTFPEDLAGEEYDEPDETPEQEKAEPDVNTVIAQGVDRWPHGVKKTDDEKEVAEGAREARDYAEEQLLPWLPQLIEAAAEAHAYGIAGAWIRVKPGGSEDGLDQIEAVSYVEPRRFKVDQARNKLQIQLDPKSAAFVDVDTYVKTGSLVIFDLAPTKPLDQKGLFWQSIIPWAMFQYGFRWWAKFLELFGIPFRSATYEANTAKARREVEEVLAKAGTSGWAALPAGTVISMSAPVGGGTGGPHQSWAEFLIRTFDQIWLGHAQASGVQANAGSQTSTDAAFSGADELIDARLSQASFWITEQVIRPLIKRNKGDNLARFHCPKLELKVRSAEDVSVLANIANIAVQAGAGDRIDADDFVQRLGFKLARRGKPTLSAPQAATQPGQPPKEQPGGAEKMKPPVAGEPPQKKKAQFSIVPKPADLIRRLEKSAHAAAQGAGDPIVGRYADVITEAQRDGADLAQTLTRVKRAAQAQGIGQAEVAEHLAVVTATAFFEGFESAAPSPVPHVLGFAIPAEDDEQFMAQGQKRAPKGSPIGGEWVK